MKKLFLFFLLISSIGACTNPPADTNQDQNTEIDSSLVKARLNYKNYCSGCHGEQMQAFVDRKWKYGDTRDSIYASINKGHEDVGMPAFEAVLSEEEINNLVSYILSGITNIDKYVFEDESLSSDTFKTELFTFHLDTIMSGIESPWGMVFLPNNELLVTEKSGKVYRISKDGSTEEITGVPKVWDKGQGGLLDIELHPDFQNNNLLYLSYSIFKTEGDKKVATTAVSRYTLVNNNLTHEVRILEAFPYTGMAHHYGSRLEFDRDGYLFISVGDRGNRDGNPQDLSVYPGKIHRVNDDGTIPEDNPFVNDEDAIPSIYSYGHRNPQGMTLNPTTGEIWAHEHGPRGGDEINIIKKGANYGWPVISYGINYDGTIFTSETEMKGMKKPVLYWVPSIAPSGMDFVEGGLYPGWEGDLLSGSLRYKYLNISEVEGDNIDQEDFVMKNIGRVRNVRMSPDGYIYIAVERPGFIFKLIPFDN